MLLDKNLDVGNPIDRNHNLNRKLAAWWLVNPSWVGSIAVVNDLNTWYYDPLIWTRQQNVLWAPGPRNDQPALQFPGSGSYIACTIGTNALDAYLQGSFSFWFQPKIVSGTQCVVGTGPLGGGVADTLLWQIRIDDQKVGVQAWWNGGGINNLSQTPNVMTAGTWTHVTVTGDWSAWAIYINGVSQTLSQLVGVNSGAWMSWGAGQPRYGNIGYLNGTYPAPLNGRLADVQMYSSALNAAEAWQVYDQSRRGNPDRLRRFNKRSLYLGTYDAPTSFDYTGSGTITLGGSADASVSFPFVASGTITLGGSANTSASFEHVGSGTITLGGFADASAFTGNDYTASGTITLGGAAETSVTYLHIGSGTVTLGGSADTSASFNHVAGGFVVVGGSADASAVYGNDFTASGGVILGGAAGVALCVRHAASGGITLGGAAGATESAGFSYTASGTITLDGSAPSSQSFSYVGSGGVVTGGSAGVVLVVTFVAGGTITLGGSAESSASGGFAYTASGTITLGGSAGADASISALCLTGRLSVEVVFTGEVSSEPALSAGLDVGPVFSAGLSVEPLLSGTVSAEPVLSGTSQLCRPT